MLISKFNIDIDKIKKRNLQLIKLKWTDKLNSEQKKFLNFRKGPPKQMNLDGLVSYTDLTNYLINTEKFYSFNLEDLKNYLTLFQIEFKRIDFFNVNDQLNKILKSIQNKRVESVQKYIKIEDSIFDVGIYSTDVIYRIQEKPICGNILLNSTSWSLYPIEWFCHSDNECYCYITKIPKNLQVIYVENDSLDPELKTFYDFTFYEFEYILPRNLEFKIMKRKKIKITNMLFDNKTSKNSKRIINVIWIKIIKIHRNIKFPSCPNILLITSST